MGDKEFYNCYTHDCFDCPNYDGTGCSLDEDDEYPEYEEEDNSYPQYMNELMDMEFEDRISGEY